MFEHPSFNVISDTDIQTGSSAVTNEVNGWMFYQRHFQIKVNPSCRLVSASGRAGATRYIDGIPKRVRDDTLGRAETKPTGHDELDSASGGLSIAPFTSC
jgi:hypothetical protein